MYLQTKHYGSSFANRSKTAEINWIVSYLVVNPDTRNKHRHMTIDIAYLGL